MIKVSGIEDLLGESTVGLLASITITSFTLSLGVAFLMILTEYVKKEG